MHHNINPVMNQPQTHVNTTRRHMQRRISDIVSKNLNTIKDSDVMTKKNAPDHNNVVPFRPQTSPCPNAGRQVTHTTTTKSRSGPLSQQQKSPSP